MSFPWQGRKLAVVGANGCGKSTLLSYFSGREQPKEGNIQLQPDVHITVVERLGSGRRTESWKSGEKESQLYDFEQMLVGGVEDFVYFPTGWE